MLQSPERAYLRRRALQELGMTRADRPGTERAHNELTGRYITACVRCGEEDGEECRHTIRRIDACRSMRKENRH